MLAPLAGSGQDSERASPDTYVRQIHVLAEQWSKPLASAMGFLTIEYAFGNKEAQTRLDYKYSHVFIEGVKRDVCRPTLMVSKANFLAERSSCSVRKFAYWTLFISA